MLEGRRDVKVVNYPAKKWWISVKSTDSDFYESIFYPKTGLDIGRSQNCHMSFPESSLLSFFHCLIQLAGKPGSKRNLKKIEILDQNRYILGITDLPFWSVNYTYVNNVRLISGEAKILKHGDIIHLGFNPSLSSHSSLSKSFIIICDTQLMLYKNYELLGKIGEGGFGTVFGGVRRQTSQVVAIKLLKSFSERRRQAFLKETKLIKDLKHPFIIEFVGVVSALNGSAQVTELATGGNLLEYLVEEDGLSLAVTTMISFQLLQASKYLQSKGVIHCDIKSENILIKCKRTHYIVITDFGPARYLSEIDNTVVVGTRRFGPPEIFTSLLFKSYSFKTDLWSIGITIYKMFTCRQAMTKGYDVSVADVRTFFSRISVIFRLCCDSYYVF